MSNPRFTSDLLNTLRNPRVLGFDSVLDMISEAASRSIPNYPPYDIYTVDGGETFIEVALAGWDLAHIMITREGEQLRITGNRPQVEQPTRSVLHKGIALRDFSISFVLHRDVVVGDATFTNGMLRIAMKMVVPDERKPRQIEIKTA